MKQSNASKAPTRSNHDLRMMEKYNPLRENYEFVGVGAGPTNERTMEDNAMNRKWCSKCKTWEGYENAPNWWSGVGAGPHNRTQFDKDLQQHWCPKCGYSEDYIGPRTQFDQALQKRWCPRCDGVMENFSDYRMSFNDPDNSWSYN